MRKSIFSLLAFALLASSCSLHDKFYIDLPDTHWRYVRGQDTVWVSFHDESEATIMQYTSSNGRYQTGHGPYTVDGHSVDIFPRMTSQYSLVRTYSNLKHFSTNKNFTQLRPKSYPSIEGSVWATTDTNDLHIVFFAKDGVCADVVYNNITRKEGLHYGWSANSSTYAHYSDKVDVAGRTAHLYGSFLSCSPYGLMLCSPAAEQSETSSLQGTVWCYNNVGYPADVPIAIIFTSSDTFVRITGVASAGFTVERGTYTESAGTVSLELGSKKESSPIAGGCFTVWERTYVKQDY